MKTIFHHLSGICVIVCCLFGNSILLSQDTITYQLLPSAKLMPRFTANTTEHGFCATKILNNNQYWAGLGSAVPVLNISYNNFTGDVVVAGTVFTQLDHKPGSFRVINTDFYADLLFTITWNRKTFLQFGTGHTSHHLNDDAFEILGYRSSINYVRDYYRIFLLQYVSTLNSYFYAGIFYHHTFKIPENNNPIWLFQFGGDVFNISLFPYMTAYVAFDIKYRHELRFASTQSYQSGIKIHHSSPYQLRCAFTIRRGYDERGQFYNNPISVQTLGVYFDF